MRGRPILQWILFAVSWSAISVIILHITAGEAADKPVAAALASAEPSTSWLSIRFSAKPNSFSIAHEGTVVWTGENISATFQEQQIPVAPGEYGLELVLAAEFPAQTDVAAELKLESEGYPLMSQTVWFSGSGSKTVTFSNRRHE